MSLPIANNINGNHIANANSGSGFFANYIDNGSPASNMSSIPRHTPSPTPSAPNGAPANVPGMNGGFPMNAGHQMDLNHLYEMVLQLSDVLKNNRQLTRGIVDGAEEVMKRAATDGTSPTIQEVNGEISASKISQLERDLAKERRVLETLKHEHLENTKLIGEYETAVGNILDQIRTYCHNNTMHYLSQKRHYNNLLQAERDAHLESRLDRDYWHAQTMKCAEMIRTAYRLRCEEDQTPANVVAGLQNEVRAYRSALGMPPEKPEEEGGWEILRNVPATQE